MTTLGVQLFALLTVVSLGILAPVHATAGGVAAVESMLHITIANVPKGSNLLYIHAAVSFFATWITLLLVNRHYDAVQARNCGRRESLRHEEKERA